MNVANLLAIELRDPLIAKTGTRTRAKPGRPVIPTGLARTAEGLQLTIGPMPETVGDSYIHLYAGNPSRRVISLYAGPIVQGVTFSPLLTVSD